MSVDALLDDIISKEGGYVNHKADRGGPTNFGITQRTLSNYLGRRATIQDVKNLSLDLAKEIYLANYFYGPRINTLPEEVQQKIFDMGVNHGPRRAVKIAQSVVNKAGFGPIGKDGVIGPQTRGAIEISHGEMGDYFINALVDERNAFYEAIIRNDPTQEVFKNGWLSRSNSFRVEVS
jgi:lysozyme family protein